MWMYDIYKKEIEKKFTKVIEEQDGKVLKCNQGIRKV